MLSVREQVDERFDKHTLPSGDVVFYEDKNHAYYGEIKPKSGGGHSYVRDSRLTGVSTIAKYLDPNADPLMHWAARLDRIGTAELASQAIESGGDLTWLTEEWRISAALKDAEATWAHVRNRAAMRGTNIHERILFALATESAPPSLSGLSEEERGYGQAVFAFWRDRKPEPIAAEYVTADLSLGFAGRPDLLAFIDGAITRFDAKTRESGKVRMSDHVQLQGYRAADIACGIGTSERDVALILMPDGTFREEECVATQAHFNAALLACQSGKAVEKAMRELSKVAKEPVPA
jgi:hypothetical protein